MQQYHHHRPTASDRLCGSKRSYAFRGPLKPKRDSGGFLFVVIGSSLAVVAIALAIALVSQ